MPQVLLRPIWRHALILAAGFLVGVPVPAAPFTPNSDAQVLARIPARALDAQARELQSLRAASKASPGDVDRAVALARRYIEAAAGDGDPRYMGYAQAALSPWWAEAAPPVAVRVQRAVLRQYGHGFDEALVDLEAALREEPANAEAWSWLAAIRMVRAEYAEAARACEGLAPLTSALLASACRASADSLTGRAAPASIALAVALKTAPEASPEERLWALTRQAEIAERRGSIAVAERAFKEALATGVADVYLRAAHADFLLDQGRAREVLALLEDGSRADVLLLRLAIAAKATGDKRAAGWASDLAARFAAARARGDSTHEKEEARFVLQVQGDAPRALALAQRNYALQREPADARILLETALAARQPEAALPVQRWLDANRVESVVLQALAARIGGAR
ncbi:MAG: hypothetical protein ABIQ29_02720 [Burkholderiaceae bacterium]